MSASEPASTTAPAVAPVAEQASNEPVEVQKGKADVYTYTVLSITLLVLTIVMITTVTGQWLKLKHTAYDDNTIQYDLWGNCTCSNADVLFGCKKMKELFRASAAFSVIGVISEFLAIFFLIGVWTRVFRAPRLAAVAFAWIGVIALILSWTIFVGLYDKKYCGTKVKYLGDLHWAFGLRVGESILWIIAAILITKSVNIEDSTSVVPKLALTIAATIFVISIATTTGRGWVVENRGDLQDADSIQFSVWEACVCFKAKEYPCKEERRLFRAEEAFAVLSVAFTAVLFYFVSFGLPRALHVITAFLSFSTIAVTWITYSAWFSQTHCGQAKPSHDFQLYWPYGLNVIAFIVMVVNFVIALVGLCGLF